MDVKILSSQHSRRDFISKTIFGVAASCFGCKALIAGGWLDKPDSNSQQKFLTDSGMSYEQVFNFAFKPWYIRYMKGLEAEIGKERFLEMLRTVGSKIYEKSIKSQYRDMEIRDVDSLITNFWAPMKKSRLWSHTLLLDIIKQTPSSGIVKMSDCLVAKVFREADAAEIGYAAICHADYAVAQAFNPKIKLVRNKCLMKGDDCCYFEYSL